jgi:hypothetical protein
MAAGWLLVAALTQIFVQWFRVPVAFIVYVGLVNLLENPLLFWPLVVLPPLYILLVAIHVASAGLKKSAFTLYHRAAELPLGPIIFDRLLLAFFAPHKTVYGVRIASWTPSQLVLKFEASYWLRNPFSSADVGVLCGVGELAAFASSQEPLLKANLRGIPVTTSAKFLKKSKGVLRAISVPIAPPDVSMESCQLTAEIRDAANDLCCVVTVDLHLSPLPQKSAK